MKKENPLNIRALQALLLPTLIVIFGLQMLRGFIPGLAWYMRDTVGASTLSLIPYAFGTFFLGFLAALLVRLIGLRVSLWFSTVGLVFLRLTEQLVKSPALDLWLGIAGVGLFLICMPVLIIWSRDSTEPYPGRAYQGLILGFAFDLALRGLFWMQDPSNVGGWIPAAVIALLGTVLIWSLWHERGADSRMPREGRGRSTALLLALGPYFVLQMIYFQNTGWLEEVSGLGFPAGFLIVSLGYVVSSGGFALGRARPHSLHPSLTIGASLLLIYCIYYADQLEVGALALILLGQLVLGWGLGGICTANQDASQQGAWRTTLAVNGGMVLFLILAFAYYAAQDIALPFSRTSFPTLGAGGLALLMIWASFQVWKGSKRDWNLAGTLAAGLLVLVPLACWATWETGLEGKDPPGFPVRVMTYNIHSAYNVAGAQDLEAIASVIEESGAEIIGIQEISRTRLMDGGADMPTWLAQRLGMEMVFAGTEEPIWGNAILSHYPILDSGYQALPREGTLIGRGFLWAKIDVGESAPLLVVVTHLHQIVPDSHVRLVQVPLILEFLEDWDQAVFLGDLNAEPDSPEIGLIYDAGLVDSWMEAGNGPGYTAASYYPVKRIDYLWYSPDLLATEIEIIQTEASDHMPVMVMIDFR